MSVEAALNLLYLIQLYNHRHVLLFINVFSNRQNLIVLLLGTWHKHFNVSRDLHC